MAYMSSPEELLFEQNERDGMSFVDNVINVYTAYPNADIDECISLTFDMMDEEQINEWVYTHANHPILIASNHRDTILTLIAHGSRVFPSTVLAISKMAPHIVESMWTDRDHYWWVRESIQDMSKDQADIEFFISLEEEVLHRIYKYIDEKRAQ